MGYTLECFLLDHARLKAIVGHNQAELAEEIIASEATIFDANPGVPWRAALRELIGADHGWRLARRAVLDDDGPVMVVDAAQAAAMVALVRSQGVRLGELIHNSRAGDKFRAVFASGNRQTPFAQPDLLGHLLHRPLFRTSGPIYPDWGALTLAELTRLRGAAQNQAPAYPECPDQRAWLYALNEMVDDALEAGSDVVTLYL